MDLGIISIIDRAPDVPCFLTSLVSCGKKPLPQREPKQYRGLCCWKLRQQTPCRGGLKFEAQHTPFESHHKTLP
jgi:hypothetical protein